MFKIDKDACANCISKHEITVSALKVSHYGVIFNKGKYTWFVVIKCRGFCGVPATRECIIKADNDEELYKELYGRVPQINESFRNDIEKEKGKIVKRHCEMSVECPYYDLHFMK